MSYKGTFSALSVNGLQSTTNYQWLNIQSIPETDTNDNPYNGPIINADGRYIAFGTVNNTGIGTVYIYYNNSINSFNIGSWELQTTITHGITGDYLGPLGFSDDASYILLGAMFESNDKGAAYVYTRSGTTWSQQQKLTASDGITNDNFGSSGSIDGSGTYIVIGAESKDIAGISNAGAAYIFTRNNTTWSQTQIINEPNYGQQHLFGVQLSISQDGNYIIIGCPGYGNTPPTNLFNGIGAVYMYVKNGSIWDYSVRLQGTGIQANSEFGYSVGINNNGSSIFVRANGATTPNSKNIWFFNRTNSIWSETQIYNYSSLATTTTGYNSKLSTSWKGDGSILIFGTANNKKVYAMNKTSIYELTQSLIPTGAIINYFGQEVAVSRSNNIAVISAGQGKMMYIFALG